MTFQTIELSGQRFVIMAEEEFRKLLPASVVEAPLVSSGSAVKKKFAEVEPVKVGGIPASEMLLRDRR